MIIFINFALSEDSTVLGVRLMKTPIRPIPILTGKAAERFIRLADAAEKNPHTQPCGISKEDFEKILAKAQLH